MDVTGSFNRVIALVDLDCFYCQVEANRLSLPANVPIGVQQWDHLIAVNYVAKKKGVKRSMSVKAAKEIAPDLVPVHVETYGVDGASSDPTNTSRISQKASLRRYREASTEILSLMQKIIPTCERASIDEAFLDITDIVRERLQRPKDPLDKQRVCTDWLIIGEQEAGQRSLEGKQSEHIRSNNDEKYSCESDDECAGRGEGHEKAGECGREGVEELGSQEITRRSSFNELGSDTDTGPRQVWCRPRSVFEAQLLMGARICQELRNEIYRQLNYTCSVGIAHNKTLAKLICAMNKPNGQTILPIHQVKAFLEKTPFSSIRGLGGKLGKQAQELLQVEMAGEVARLDKTEVIRLLGPKQGNFLWRVCQGIDNEPVVIKKRVQSILAAKSFPPVHSTEKLLYWVQILAQELEERIANDRRKYHRVPRLLTVSFRRIRAKQKMNADSVKQNDSPNRKDGSRGNKAAEGESGKASREVNETFSGDNTSNAVDDHDSDVLTYTGGENSTSGSLSGINVGGSTDGLNSNMSSRAQGYANSQVQSRDIPSSLRVEESMFASKSCSMPRTYAAADVIREAMKILRKVEEKEANANVPALPYSGREAARLQAGCHAATSYKRSFHGNGHASSDPSRVIYWISLSLGANEFIEEKVVGSIKKFFDRDKVRQVPRDLESAEHSAQPHVDRGKSRTSGETTLATAQAHLELDPVAVVNPEERFERFLKQRAGGDFTKFTENRPSTQAEIEKAITPKKSSCRGPMEAFLSPSSKEGESVSSESIGKQSPRNLVDNGAKGPLVKYMTSSHRLGKEELNVFEKTGDGDDSGWFICEKCGESIERSSQNEHSDFHFAKELQNSLRRGTDITARSTKCSIDSHDRPDAKRGCGTSKAQLKRRKIGGKGQKSTMRTIEMAFFGSKSS